MPQSRSRRLGVWPVSGRGNENSRKPVNEGLPDSQTPYGLCPRCSKQSSFEVEISHGVTFSDEALENRDRDYSTLPRDLRLEQVSVLVCRNCLQSTVVLEEGQNGEGRPWYDKAGTIGCSVFKGVNWWPTAEAQVSADVPTDIGEAFVEAVGALRANCPRAAAVMARRTLEAITSDKGENGDNLAGRLERMAKQGLLQPVLSDWAREVRLVGNAGAHFDPLQTVSRDDAQQLITFIGQLIQYLYELPAQLVRKRATSQT